MATCTVEGCGRKSVSRGLCNTHRMQMQRRGSLSLVRERTGELTSRLEVRLQPWLLELCEAAAAADAMATGRTVHVAEWAREVLLAAVVATPDLEG